MHSLSKIGIKTQEDFSVGENQLILELTLKGKESELNNFEKNKVRLIRPDFKNYCKGAVIKTAWY